MSEGPTPEQLLADAAWLRRLALRLAGNPDDADDLVQESWIAVWRRRPDQSRSLRPWFTKVVRDLAIMKLRSDRGRSARDQVWEASRKTVSPDEVLEQVRLHRLLADLVLELDEPQRSTIVARFVEGRTSAEIARALGIPESTVRGRLHDGLARLRKRLDERLEHRKAWAPAVLAFARGGMTVAKPAHGVLVLVAMIVLLAVGLVATALHRRSPATARAPAVTQHAASGPTSAAETRRLDLVLGHGSVPGWIAQAGAPTRRIAGRVVADGAPVAGAMVRLTSEISLAGLLPTLERRTTADGTFDFGPQLAREVTVSASASGKLATILAVDLRDPSARPDELELALTPCSASLYGKVLDAAGGPIEGAQVRRQDAMGTDSAVDGSYELCVLPSAPNAEQFLVVVRAAGYGSIATAFAPDGRVRHDFVLAPEATISGTAVTAAGSPVSNAEVWAEPDEGEGKPEEQSARTVTVTDEHGRFQLVGLAGGRHRLGARGAQVTAPPVVVSVAAGETREVTLTMLDVGLVRGRVVQAGQPISGAHVAVAGCGRERDRNAPDNCDAPDSAVSQADGSFVLDRVPVGDIRLTAAPFRVVSPPSLRVQSGDNPEVLVSVEPLGRIFGTVRFRGASVSHARVSVFGPTRSGVLADARGRYELAGLEPGTYSLVADDARRVAYVDGVRIALASGEARQFDPELTTAASASGVVVDERGSPVGGAYVRLAQRGGGDEGRCITDASGSFECRELAGGTYDVVVSPVLVGSAPYAFAGPTPPPVVLAGRDARVDGLRLVVHPEQLAIRGAVVDRSGDPISDARVRIASRPSEGMMPAPSGITGLDGKFHIEGLAPGTYSLIVRTRDGATSEHRAIQAGRSDVQLVIGPTCDDKGSIVHDVPGDIRQRPAGMVVWDARVELLGWNMPAVVRMGEEFELTFYYRVLAPIDRSWKTFVHVDGTEQRLSLDHQPLGGRCPMASWRPGDIMIDRFTGRFAPGDQTPGDYKVTTGFFIGWAGRWLNMPLSDGPADARASRDALLVGVISVH